MKITKTDKIAITLALTLLISVALLSIESFAYRCGAVRQETLRLHIIAASDSDEDQSDKLAVRDKILEDYSEVLCAGSPEAACALAQFLSDDIKTTAQKQLSYRGRPNEVSVSVEDMFFETRTYDEGVTLPAGHYKALRLVIGEGKGKNWWCVIYPPLCLPAAEAGETAADEENDIRDLSLQSGYKAKFAVVEAFEQIKEVIRGAKEG